VIGAWHRSPVGAFADVMWGTPDGARILLSPDERAERFITAVYEFDQVVQTSIEVRASESSVWVSAPPLEVRLDAGPGWRIPGPRPLWFTRWVEGPIARVAMGVDTYGVSPTGVAEWYQASVWRPVVSGWARRDGVDLGPIGPLDPPMGVGFTDPPARPSIVTVQPTLADPSGKLDQLLGPSGRT
jgi:hypothetical protein